MCPLDHKVNATMAVAPASRSTLEYCLFLICTYVKPGMERRKPEARYWGLLHTGGAHPQKLNLLNMKTSTAADVYQ